MDEKQELLIKIPEGCTLVGTRTEGNVVIVVFERLKAKERKVGFVQE